MCVFSTKNSKTLEVIVKTNDSLKESSGGVGVVDLTDVRKTFSF